jgi:hypothetical protein
MNASLNKSLSWRLLGSMLLFGLALLAGMGPLALAQETLQGKFTLADEARLRNTILPPGQYKFSIQPVGTTHSLSSLQTGNDQVIVTVSGLAKGTPIISGIAMASRINFAALKEKEMDLRSDETGSTLHSIVLENLGIVLEFYDYKTKSPLHAHAPELARRKSSS